VEPQTIPHNLRRPQAALRPRDLTYRPLQACGKNARLRYKRPYLVTTYHLGQVTYLRVDLFPFYQKWVQSQSPHLRGKEYPLRNKREAPGSKGRKKDW
jgi:hypothetical protein